MKQDRLRSSYYNQHHFIFKIGISILLVGFGFRFLFSQSPDVIIPNETDDNNINIKAPVLDTLVKPLSSDFDKELKQFQSKDGECDVSDGEWIPSSGSPAYTNDTCRWIERDQNCIGNGRPDTGYMYWKWRPKSCELPRFDAKKFLEMMRDKSWAFVGDSITRNHLQSFICLLSQVEDAVELYHSIDYKNRKWHFPTYNLTVSVVWSPFLAKADITKDMIPIHLDVLDKIWTEQFHTWDYVLFSSGKWFVKSAFYYENKSIIGCHGCEGKNNTGFGFNLAYQKILDNLLDFIINSNSKSTIIYRTSTPDHFENGTWSTGGTCHRTVPANKGEFELGILNKILRDVELTEIPKAEERASEKGIKLKHFDVTPLSLVRPDGHPGPYRQFYPFAEDKDAKVQYDCLHWCLPGPIDTWTDMLMNLVVNG